MSVPPPYNPDYQPQMAHAPPNQGQPPAQKGYPAPQQGYQSTQQGYPPPPQQGYPPPSQQGYQQQGYQAPPPPYQQTPNAGYPPGVTQPITIVNTGPAPVQAQPQTVYVITNTTRRPQKVNHVLHLIITIFFWPWIFVWLILILSES